ncbi:sodium symporter family protein [Colletotrichum graminicola]|nr:sodium symporter family protein [Colletotrichum graminicola]
MVTAALSQGVGYGIVLGLGLLFAIGMIATTYVLKRYNRELQTSENFTTAGRTVKSGLVGSAVVSSWTWAATLLQSSGVCYRYGVSGPFWYASGATVQILLFATLAIELKRRAPNAHTFLEVIKARYGTATHLVFIVFGLMTNILVTLMLIVGGAATVNALTGMHTVAAIYLLPVGVVAYTLVGGLKATFLTDWVHTFILLIIIIIFSLTTYANSDVLGSPSKVYDLLVEAAFRHPVSGNAEGSYLTMKSQGGVEFFVINIGEYSRGVLASTATVSGVPRFPNVNSGQLWHRLPGQRLLQQGHRRVSRPRSPRLHPRRPLVVRHPLADGHDHGPLGPGPRVEPALPDLPQPHDRRRGFRRSGPPLRRCHSPRQGRRSGDPADDLHGRHLGLVRRAHRRVLHLHLRHLPDLLQARRQRQAPHLHVPRCRRRVRHRHQLRLRGPLLQRHLHGIPLPAHGRPHLRRRAPCHPDPRLEGPEQVGGDALAHHRHRLRHHRLARHCQEDVRRPRRGVHGLQQPDAGRQRHRPALPACADPDLHAGLWHRQVRLEVDDGHPQGRRP